VRSPDAPKIISKHESPVGNGSSENFSNGFASTIVAKITSGANALRILDAFAALKLPPNLSVL
jgi:hypothetical protein